MKLIKKVIYLGLLLSVFLLGGCSWKISQNELPDAKPKDFNFVFNYGIGAKNQLDTTKGKYTKDMVSLPSVTTNLTLTDKEMNSIYKDMKKIHILSYPESFKPKSNLGQKPFETYSITIVFNGKKKNIYWCDENISRTKEATELRQLFNKIRKIIINKEEYKKLPPAKGGYD